MVMRLTDYQRRMDELHAGGVDYSWANQGNGAHNVTTYPTDATRDGDDVVIGPMHHEHFRADGSRFQPVRCGCFI